MLRSNGGRDEGPLPGKTRDDRPSSRDRARKYLKAQPIRVPCRTSEASYAVAQLGRKAAPDEKLALCGTVVYHPNVTVGQTNVRCAAVTKHPLVCLAGYVEESHVYGHPKVAGIGPTPANRPAEMTAAKRSFPPPDLRCGTFRFPIRGRFRAHTLFSGHMSAR